MFKSLISDVSSFILLGFVPRRRGIAWERARGPRMTGGCDGSSQMSLRHRLSEADGCIHKVDGRFCQNGCMGYQYGLSTRCTMFVFLRRTRICILSRVKQSATKYHLTARLGKALKPSVRQQARRRRQRRRWRSAAPASSRVRLGRFPALIFATAAS